ncbi:hypothetical protein RF007C_15750 [Ruminococcus flavefaciens 007c]|uniref:DUF5050 domain-containing protein n=2 Tax=Ruminococcus flavefaciens TaxID=1265 RepID=W7UN98_RUMFL|nr:hypothetical protein RF007C_15750 [Ruminococcus flavefaciens 007c]
MKNYRIVAAVLGALLAAPIISGCSDNNTPYDSEAVISSAEVTTAEKTTVQPETVASDEKKQNASDFGAPSEEMLLNNSPLLYIMDNGDYIYSAVKKEGNTHYEVYVRDDRKGRSEELGLPQDSVIFYSDGKKLYYYSPDEGLCVYDNGKSSLLCSETKSEERIPQRNSFFFAENYIFFTVPGENGTEIRIMDYTGELSEKSFHIDHRNAGIICNADIDGGLCLICSYPKGTDEHIIAFDGSDSYTELAVGYSPLTAGDMLYYIDFNKLYRLPLSGGEPQQLTDTLCKSYCIYDDKLIFTDGKTVFSSDGSSEPKELISYKDLEGCDFIRSVRVTDGRLFVMGGAGAFHICLSELDKDGKITEKVYSDNES